MAVALEVGRPGLFITITGSSSTFELERLRDGRETQTLTDLANRCFAIKLRKLLDDIIKKQIFGKVVGEIWVNVFCEKFVVRSLNTRNEESVSEKFRIVFCLMHRKSEQMFERMPTFAYVSRLKIKLSATMIGSTK